MLLNLLILYLFWCCKLLLRGIE